MDTRTPDTSDINRTLEIETGSGGGKSREKWIIITFLAVLALIAAVAILKNTGKTDAVQYKTQEAISGDLTVIVTATGTLQPTNQVDVGSELSGTVKSVEVTYNDRVKVGQILARLDTTKLEAQVTQAQAALDAAKSKVLQTQATVKEAGQKLLQLENLRRLSNNKVPSQADIDAQVATHERAMADEASARASVAQYQASLDAYKTDLTKAIIRSPINGVVLTRSIEPGQTVAAAYQAPTLFTLAEDLTKMELHVNVDEADIGKIAEGQAATFTVSAYSDRVFKARITQARYGSTTTSGVVTYETVLKVDNTDLALRPGMTATADIMVKKLADVLLIPNTALRFTPPAQAATGEQTQPSRSLIGAIMPRPPRHSTKPHQETDTHKKRQQVWVLEDGQPMAVPITIGSTNGSVTEVTSGEIRPGTSVLIDYQEKGK